MKNKYITSKCISIFAIMAVLFTLSSCDKKNTSNNSKNAPKNIYYKWTTSADCPFPSGHSLTYNHPDLPSILTKNQQYGPISAGVIELIANDNIGRKSTGYINLSSPPDGYKRIYTHNVFQFNFDLNRCVFYINESIALTYVDLPM